jgi:hypothetical protein
LTVVATVRILQRTMTCSIPRVLSLGLITLALPGLPGASAG